MHWRTKAHDSSTWEIAFAGDRVVTTSVGSARDPNAKLWDVNTGAQIGDLVPGEGELKVEAHDASAHSVDFSADGLLLLTAGFEDQLAKVWDSKTGELKATMRGHEHRIMCARFSPSAGEVLTTSWDRTGRLWDAETGQQLMLMRGMVNGCAFHPGGRFVATGFDFEIHDVSADTRSPVELLDHVRTHHGNPWHLVSGRLVLKD